MLLVRQRIGVTKLPILSAVIRIYSVVIQMTRYRTSNMNIKIAQNSKRKQYHEFHTKINVVKK